MLGFAFLGIHNLLVELGMGIGAYWVSPLAVAATTSSSTPALHALANALTESLEISLVGVVVPLYFLYQWPRVGAIVAGLWTGLLFNGLVGWWQPWPASFLWLVVLGTTLALLFLRFDVTTLFFALFTLELWFMGFPNWVLFRAISPGGFYIVFFLWGAVAALGSWALWGPSIHKAYRRVAAGF